MAFGDIYVVIKFRSMFCSIIRHKRKAQHNLFCLTIKSGYDETMQICTPKNKLCCFGHKTFNHLRRPSESSLHHQVKLRSAQFSFHFFFKVTSALKAA